MKVQRNLEESKSSTRENTRRNKKSIQTKGEKKLMSTKWRTW